MTAFQRGAGEESLVEDETSCLRVGYGSTMSNGERRVSETVTVSTLQDLQRNMPARTLGCIWIH